MNLEISVALAEFKQADDLCKDWLIKSWSLKDEDFKIARLYYQKADKERTLLAKRLVDLTKTWRTQD